MAEFGLPKLGRTCRHDDAGLVGEDNDLEAVPQVEFGQNAGDVGFDGRLADDEVPGDLLVGMTSCDNAGWRGHRRHAALC
jgi:hypothetical protein